MHAVGVDLLKTLLASHILSSSSLSVRKKLLRTRFGDERDIQKMG
jgi:hypothetical protein